MLKHVLVPLDGSQLAEDALQHAASILGADGRMTLVSAVEVPEVPIYGYYPPATIPDYDAAKADLLPQARAYLDGVAKNLKRLHPEMVISIEAEIGEPAEIITNMAEKYHVDAIVMSTHGRSGLSRWLFGSVTNKVLSAKPCPVYVVPSQSNGHKK
ncbi:MAG: universal stress protein [Anaerolineae bacterium]|nr:universal stress protein [Anaerolineae bacterium]